MSKTRYERGHNHWEVHKATPSFGFFPNDQKVARFYLCPGNTPVLRPHVVCETSGEVS